MKCQHKISPVTKNLPNFINLVLILILIRFIKIFQGQVTRVMTTKFYVKSSPEPTFLTPPPPFLPTSL